MIQWPDIVEALALGLFAGDLIARGHASDVAGIVAVLLIRAARALWPKPVERKDPSGAEMQALRDQLDQLKSDVSRVSLVVGITKAG